MNISQRLRTCARHTGLDAVIELLQEAADEIDALQASAKVQGDPSWWMRETGEGAEWTDTAPLVLSGWTPLYTASQPAQATQAEVMDEELLDAYNSIDPCNESPTDRLIRRLRAILALRPQAVPMTDEQFTQLLRKLKRSREVFQAGRDSYETACAPMNSDDEAWFAYLAHHGITQRADGGEQQA